MKKAKKIRSKTAVTLLLLLSIGLTWLASMVCLTLVTAQGIYDDLYAASYDLPNDVHSMGNFSLYYDRNFPHTYGTLNEQPELMEYRMLKAISDTVNRSVSTVGYYPYISHVSFSEERTSWLRDIRCPMETAVLFYDGDGNLLHGSEDDILFFDYYTQEEWDAGEDSAGGRHYGWIDISEGKEEGYPNDPYLRLRNHFSNNGGRLWDFTFRMTGTFEGTQFIPVRMDYIDRWSVSAAIEGNEQFTNEDGGYSYIFSDVERAGLLEWQEQFDRTDEYTGDPNDLVTIYADYPQMWDYEETPLTYNGQEYTSLAHLTRELEVPNRYDTYIYSNDLRAKGVYQLNELLIFSGREYAEYANYPSGEAPIDLILVTAVRSNPLLCALRALRNIYIATGLLALVLFLIVRSCTLNRLIRPVESVVSAMQDNWKNLSLPGDAPPMWAEADELTSEFKTEQNLRRFHKNEITRLNTALEYAKTAEQNRRQMTSSIAHELKTPLAVIHSYAEGLKEHIAEDRRDQYLDVILAEVKRTDGMVLEMLDLSRLEAGKVKLARDEFSLAELTRSVFGKLERAMQSKNLRLEYHFPEQSMVTADETRIAQVIENFATNAVKYTPDGGRITVVIRTGQSLITLTVENERAPLSWEALNKVWDTFYRVDDSRSGGGTGLGLAIAKNIIELHGGTCFVHNTAMGVEFGFTLK